jgi:hypothetical protein
MKAAIAALLGALMVCAAAEATAQDQRRGPLAVTVTCQYTPLWIFLGRDNLPRKAPEPYVTLGQRFEVIGGLRTTLGGFQYWETNVVAVEPGYGALGAGGYREAHYWLSADCALPNRYVPR